MSVEIPQANPGAERILASAQRRFRRRQWARRWLKIRWPVLVLVLAGLIVAGVWLVFFSSVLVVRSVSVEGAHVLSPAAIEQAAAVPTDIPLAQVDIGAITHRVAALPAVKSVEVSRAWPDTIQISVTERTAIASVTQGGSTWALSADGVLFAPLQTTSSGLPQLRVAPGASTGVLREGADLLQALPGSLAGKVAYVDLASADDITLHLNNGDLVHWGSASETDAKARVLAVLLRRPGSVYDVSSPGQPTVRP